jgi:hypothetical protein
MARDQDPKTSRIYDRRTVDRSIKKGLLTRKDFEKHLKSLEDVADKGVYGTEPEVDDDIDEGDAADETETETEPETSASSN